MEEGVRGRGGRDGRRAHLVFLGLVGGGYVSQILDHLLGVFSFTCTRLSSVEGERQRKTQYRERDGETAQQTTIGDYPQKQNQSGFNVVIQESFFNKFLFGFL